MTKVTDFIAGRIAEYHARTVSSVAATARHFRLAWHTIKRALSRSAPRGQRKPRRVPAPIVTRRAQITALATTTLSKGNATWCEFPSAPALKVQLALTGCTVSARTVQRDLRAAGFTSRVRKNVPTRDANVVRARARFCARMRRKGNRWMARIVFSDEHGMSTNDHSNRRQWVRPGDTLLTREKKRPTNVPRVQVFAAIGIGYKSDIILLRPTAAQLQDDARASFRQTAVSYIRRCLAKIKHGLRGRIFMQDGASAHTAGSTMAYLHGQGIEVLADWPPYSPDLNPIEHLWAELNRRVSNMHPQTQGELEAFTVVAWAAIPQSLIDKYVKGFLAKVRRCFAKGGHA